MLFKETLGGISVAVSALDLARKLLKGSNQFGVAQEGGII